VLAALADDIDAASGEQKAIAQWLAARIAIEHGERDQAERSLREARRLAGASGVRQLQLRIALTDAREDRAKLAALDRPTSELGHAALRLEWLRLRMRQALEDKDARSATTAYNEAAALLRTGDAQPAYALHLLGASARAASGDAAGAAAASARAQEALARLHAQLPQSLRAGFDQAIAAYNSAPTELSP
jgi:hypothetical protein